MAKVRTAELAAQKLVRVFASAPDCGSAIDGLARPAAANPVAMSAPAPLSTRRAARLRPEKCVSCATSGRYWTGRSIARTPWAQASCRRTCSSGLEFRPSRQRDSRFRELAAFAALHSCPSRGRKPSRLQ